MAISRKHTAASSGPGSCSEPSLISVVLAFLFVHMFDTAGTLMGVAQRANLVAPDGRIENLSKALKAGTGKYKEISASLWVLCAIFIAKFVFL